MTIKQSDILFKTTVPLWIAMGKAGKKFILNLNNYRNLHYRSLNNAKQNYSALVENKLPSRFKIPHDQPIMAIYVYYAQTKRKIDVANPCSIIDKFTCDAIVKKGLLIDDNIDYLKEVRYVYGGVDRGNPRCDLYLVKHHPDCYGELFQYAETSD